MFTRLKKIAATLSTALLLNVCAGNVLAEGHSHSHGAGEPAQLTLDHGRKWPTDANLRQGMERIRDALAAELPAIHAGKMTAGQYRALAQKVNVQTEFMVKNCKLDQQADAMLHLVLADIVAGADAMAGQGGSKARKGAEKIVHALETYGRFFEHSGWRGVSHAH
ncbi:MAG: hypothetical protein EPN14_02710 [Gallionella sp.]|nr:MAG: hypothetical protein EPN14_02710 [Gallionella sp.]